MKVFSIWWSESNQNNLRFGCALLTKQLNVRIDYYLFTVHALIICIQFQFMIISFNESLCCIHFSNMNRQRWWQNMAIAILSFCKDTINFDVNQLLIYENWTPTTNRRTNENIKIHFLLKFGLKFVRDNAKNWPIEISLRQISERYYFRCANGRSFASNWLWIMAFELLLI